MLYLLDANVLMDANRDYYPIERVPEFWEWHTYKGSKGFVKIPIEIVDEIKEGKDRLSDWIKDDENKETLILNEEVDISFFRNVIENGYADDFDDVEIEKIGRDPFLIAHALFDKDKRFIVTTEVSKPKKKRANRPIPDVCNSLDVKCINSFEFLRDLGFRTNWKTS